MLDPEALKITAMIIGPALPILLVWAVLSR
jgi:hypothetical protein